MGFRFYKSIKIAPGLRINLSKSGPSLSVGKPGATVNIGRRGTRTTVGAPGTGMSYSEQHAWGRPAGASKPGSQTSKSVGKPSTTSRKPASAPGSPTRPADTVNLSYVQRLNLSPEEQALLEGCQALAGGDEITALVKLRQAVHLADGAYLAGLLSLKQGQYGDAVSFLSYCLEKQSELGTLLRKYGLAAEISLPITEEVEAKITPHPEGVLLALAEAHQRLSQPADAVDCLRRLLQTQPQELIVRLALAELLVDNWPTDRAACDEAIQLAEGVSNESEYHAALLLYKARALRAIGLQEGARDMLTDVLRRTKDRSVELLCALRFERALAYQALGQTTESRKDFERIYALDTQYEDVAKRLGL
jgi:tetratricopeptide (TPR) repeat protein